MSNFPYCEKCLKQPTTDTKEFYDYRFDYPVCISCVEEYDLEVECENHTWTLQMNLPNIPIRNYCEECGAIGEADPDDVLEQIRLLGENE